MEPDRTAVLVVREFFKWFKNTISVIPFGSGQDILSGLISKVFANEILYNFLVRKECWANPMFGY